MQRKMREILQNKIIRNILAEVSDSNKESGTFTISFIMLHKFAII